MADYFPKLIILLNKLIENYNEKDCQRLGMNMINNVTLLVIVIL